MQVAGFSVPSYTSAVSTGPTRFGGRPMPQPEEPQHPKCPAVGRPSPSFQQLIERLKRFFHALGKAVRQLLGRELPPKHPFKQLYKQETKALNARFNNEEVDASLKKLGEHLPGAEILQTPQGRDQAMHQLPILALQQLNQGLSDDKNRNDFITAVLLQAAHETSPPASHHPLNRPEADGNKPSAPSGESPRAQENGPDWNQLLELISNLGKEATDDKEKPAAAILP